jgi:hypothetical protein
VLDLVNPIYTTQSNVWTASQVVTPSATTYTASWTPNFSLSNTFNMTVTGNMTINSPTNASIGGTYLIILQQDATGSRTVTFNPSYKFPAGTTSGMSSAANSYTVYSIFVLSGSVNLVTVSRGY